VGGSSPPRNMSRNLVLLLAILFAIPVFSQDLSTFTPILLPVYTSAPIHGAFGTDFGTGLPWAISDRDQRWFPSAAGSFETLPANMPRFLEIRGFSTYGGRILFFFEDATVTLSHHLNSSSPFTLHANATAIPTVRPEQFFDKSFPILNVPLASDATRAKLVVY